MERPVIFERAKTGGRSSAFLWVILSVGLGAAPLAAQVADLILDNGRVVTVDPQETVAEAMAIRGERILRVGTSAEVMNHRGAGTRLFDLAGKAVLPGLIDSHTHPASASLTEFDHPIPDMESIQDVLAYVRERTKVVPEEQWIVLQQVFITRLKEKRYPSRAELDAVAPNHPHRARRLAEQPGHEAIQDQRGIGGSGRE
jgi:predicted amidohydrolase YtcJ